MAGEDADARQVPVVVGLVELDLDRVLAQPQAFGGLVLELGDAVAEVGVDDARHLVVGAALLDHRRQHRHALAPLPFAAQAQAVLDVVGEFVRETDHVEGACYTAARLLCSGSRSDRRDG